MPQRLDDEDDTECTAQLRTTELCLLSQSERPVKSTSVDVRGCN